MPSSYLIHVLVGTSLVPHCSQEILDDANLAYFSVEALFPTRSRLATSTCDRLFGIGWQCSFVLIVARAEPMAEHSEFEVALIAE